MAEANAAAPTRLTKQEVVNVLDSIPTFNIVTIADTRIMGTMDETGEECVRFWTDPDEAGSALVVAQAMKEDVPLRLAVTPLGTAFALAEGWQQTPSALKLKLHASKTIIAGLSDDLGAAADNCFPLFCCDELCNDRVRPFFLSRQDLNDTWITAGKPAAEVPSELTVVLLPKVVNMMLTAHGGIDWRTCMFIGSHKALAKAQEVQEAEAAAAAKQDDPEAEPPPLQ